MYVCDFDDYEMRHVGKQQRYADVQVPHLFQEASFVSMIKQDDLTELVSSNREQCFTICFIQIELPSATA